MLIVYPLAEYFDVVLLFPHFLVGCVHALSDVGVYFTPFSINIIDVSVSRFKSEAGAKGGKYVVVTEIFVFGGNVDGGSGGGTDEGGGED